MRDILKNNGTVNDYFCAGNIIVNEAAGDVFSLFFLRRSKKKATEIAYIAELLFFKASCKQSFKANELDER